MRLSRAVRLPLRPTAVGVALLVLCPALPVPALAATPTAGRTTVTGSTTTDGIAAAVARLDAEVTRVSDELARGAAAYEAAQARLVVATEGQFSARDDSEARRAQVLDARTSFAGLARAAYKGSVPTMLTALLSGDPRTVHDLERVHEVVTVAAAQRREHTLDAQRLGTAADLELARSDVDRREALALRQLVAQRLFALQLDADRLTAELSVTAARLEQARAADRARAAARARAERREALEREAALRAAREQPSGPALPGPAFPTIPGTATPASEGAGCQPPGPYGEANGFLSDEGLCPLAVGGGHRLRTDAARAFDQLSAAHVAASGRPLCVTDSYRSYAAQVDVFRRKPGLAATPGRSQHGWGLAVDLCGGVQDFGSAEHLWLRAHGPAFGWVHPAWARADGSKPEAWHWEYAGGPSTGT